MTAKMRKLAQLPYLFMVLVLLGGCAALEEKPRHQVVIQISDDNVRTWQTAFNVVNNLSAAFGKSNLEIEVVAFGEGVQALAFDSKAASRIPGAMEKGAKVIACENSMMRFKLARKDMAPEIDYVRAGVQRIIQRQREGWTVIRP